MRINAYLRFVLVLLLFASCQHRAENSADESLREYFDQTGRDDLQTGGVKLIPITTPKGEFKVWTKRTGNNPTIKVLLVHGGPGATHEYFESADSYFPGAEIEYYYYDQLESARSDQPKDPDLWTIDRFVEEVEQVRIALGLNEENFFLLGHSWGGILGIEYALKYQDKMKGLIISNMMSSIPEYDKYANEVLGPQLDSGVLEEIKALEADGKYTDERYIELVTTHYYPKHVLRKPLDEWPEPVNRSFSRMAGEIYLGMQGPSEFGIVGDVVLKNWDRSKDLGKISIPTLSIGGEYDTMDPEHMEWMSAQLPLGSYLHCPNSAHMAMYDDHKIYWEGVIDFLEEADSAMKK